MIKSHRDSGLLSLTASVPAQRLFPWKDVNGRTVMIPHANSYAECREINRKYLHYPDQKSHEYWQTASR